ncbi:hypothetical protein ACQY0O_000372 [Thecaphora frezii]
MFSQWRGKRHYPVADAETISSALHDADEADERSSGSTSARSPLRIHVKKGGLRSKAGGPIGKGTGRGRRSKESSSPSYDFAAGPRSGSRGAMSFEFGGGVVPEPCGEKDDGFSEDSSTPVHFDVARQNLASAPPMAVIGFASGPPSPLQLDTVASFEKKHSHVPTPENSLGDSVGGGGDFSLTDYEDFRAILALATSPLSEEFTSPALTDASNMTTPDTVSGSESSYSPQKRGFEASASQHRRVTGPSPPRHKASSSIGRTSAETGTNTGKPSLAEALAIFGAPPSAHLYDDKSLQPITAKDSSSCTHARTASASSFPETVSGPSSTHTDSNEFDKPATAADGIASGKLASLSTEYRTLSNVRLAESHERHGLGIFSGDEAKFEKAETSARSSQIKTSSMGNGYTTSSHSKSESVASTLSSISSWARSSRRLDPARLYAEGGDGAEISQSHRLACRLTNSDSDFSISTAETSHDVHESGPLSTITEKIEEAQVDHARQQPSTRQATDEERLIGSTSTTEVVSASPQARRKASCGHLDSVPASPSNPGTKPHSASTDETSTLHSAEDSTTPTAPAFDPPTPGSVPWSRMQPTSNPLTAVASPSASDVTARASAHGLATETTSSTAPMPSMPFTGSMLTTPDVHAGPGFSSLPASPNFNISTGQSRLGPRRKAPPAALTLSKSTSNLSAPSSSSALSPGGTLRGASSPTRSRAPPPSVPPPDEPLPPLPPTPSLIGPRSPLILSRKSSAANLARALSDAPSTPRLMIPAPKTPTLASPAASPTSAPAVQAAKPSAMAPGPAVPASPTVDLRATAEKTYSQRNPEPPNPDRRAEQRLSELLETQVCRVGYSSSTEELDDGSVLHAGRNYTATTNNRDSIISVESSDIPVEDDAQLAVATTLTRAPSAAVRMRLSRDPAKPNSNAEGASPGAAGPATSASREVASAAPTRAVVASSATGNTVKRLKAQIEGRAAQQSVLTAPKPLQSPVHRTSPVPPSAWTRRLPSTHAYSASPSRDTSAASDVLDSARAATEGGHERLTESALELPGGLGRRASFGSMRGRRLEMVQDKNDFASASNDEVKAKILKRTEGRFTDAFGEIAFTFKQLLAEKRMLEQIIREMTPLDGLGENGQGLVDYIVDMNARLDSNTVEIRKLLDLLEQQRIIIEKMLETHRIETDSYLNEIDELHRHLDATEREADMHRANAIRFNEDLDRAHQETIAAKAEALKSRNALEATNAALRGARERLQAAESGLTSRDKALDELEVARSADRNSLEAEVDLLREALARAGVEAPVTKLKLLRSEARRRAASPDSTKHGEIKLDTPAGRPGSHGSACEPSTETVTADATRQDCSVSPRGAPSERGPTAQSESELLVQLQKENADLKKSLMERDAELVQARLGSGDGAAEWFDDASSVPPISDLAADSSASTEIKRLRAMLAEQRNRESQIRTAYKIMREELRKTQSGFQTERRRNSAFGLAGHGVSPLVSTGASWNPIPSHHNGEDGGGSEPSVQLKRLSLPLTIDPAALQQSLVAASPDHASSWGFPPASDASRSASFRTSCDYSMAGPSARRKMSGFRVGIPVRPSTSAEVAKGAGAAEQWRACAAFDQ